MEVSLKTMFLKSFVKKMTFLITFLLLEHLNKIGVVERNIRSLQEMARTMLLESGLSSGFWAKAIKPFVISKTVFS